MKINITKSPLIFACTALPWSLTSHAVSFNVGDVEGHFDSKVSVGASWATAEPEDHLIGKNNGGTGSSTTADDGRLNFNKGDTFSKIIKGIHDLDLRYGSSGAFFRGKYWYDVELKEDDHEHREISDNGRHNLAKSSGAQLLDAFAYHNYYVWNQPGSIRLGSQVISWGESTFIGGGINTINPQDVSAFRRPGAEIKEGLIPVNMLTFSQSINASLSVELFYQLDWEPIVQDNCGTFFGGDNAAQGCDYNTIGPSGETLDGLMPGASALVGAMGSNVTSEGLAQERLGDRKARNDGQYGAAIRYYANDLDTEFGVYAMNYHSRLPYVSWVASDDIADLDFAPTVCTALGVPLAGCEAFFATNASAQQAAFAHRLGTAKYFLEYPEDIKLYGLSFSTNLATGTALSGEVSYRPNAPLQINGADMVASTAGLEGASPLYTSGEYQIENGAELTGFQRKPVSQLQVTAVHFFDQVMGASRMSIMAEAALTHVDDLDENELRYGRDASFGQGATPVAAYCATTTNPDNAQHCNRKGFTTENAWGYRMRATWEYSNAFAGVTLKPNVSWSHDVEGYGPTTNAFSEGAKAISLGLDGQLGSTYQASLSYTNYFGGEFNTKKDRDFASVNMSINF